MNKLILNFYVVLILLVTGCNTTQHSQRELASLPQACFETNTCKNQQHSQLLFWAEDKLKYVSTIDVNNRTEREQFEEPDYLIVTPKKLVTLNDVEKARIQEATDTYFKVMGKNSLQSFLWTGIEPGNPLTRFEEYRWNSLREQGMYEPAKRKKLIQQMKRLGIRNMRLGLSNHEIDLNDDSTWNAMTEMIKDFYEGGIYISLDLHHFGIEDRFRVLDSKGKTDGAKSYYLNKYWPDYFAAFAEMTVKKYGKYIKAITIMNEPETVVGFNGEMWHGGFPGWSHPQSNQYYVERSLQLGIASVKARLKIENYLAKLPEAKRPHFLYVHTEASVHKLYWEEFNTNRRFIVSDMILGHEGILNGSIEAIRNMSIEELSNRWHVLPKEQRTNFDWIIENHAIYNRPFEQRAQARDYLLSRVTELRNLHAELKTKHNKTMRSDTIFAIDYYAHNEDKDKDGGRLSPEPQNYVPEINAGRRVGFYYVLTEYYNHYKMPIMGGELGTPYYYYGSKWNQQMMLEAAQAASQGVPFLGYTVYPGIDTWGWESALSVPRKDAIYNPSGIFNLEMEPRPFIEKLIGTLKPWFREEVSQ